MNKLGIKKGIALLLGITLITLTGCKKHESKTLKELGDIGKYITIDYAEGASFDVRREDYGEVNMYMPKTYFNEQTEVPVIYNAYEGFALFHNQKYLYFYDREAELPVSLNDMTNSDDILSCLKKMGIDLDFATFRFKDVDNLSMALDEKNIKYCFELKFSYQPRYTRENIHMNDLSGFGIITEDENGKNSIFIFGCLENMATEDEIEHIKESFTLNNNEFHIPEEDLQMKSVSLKFDWNILEGDFQKCFYLESEEEGKGIYEGGNDYYKVHLEINELPWNNNGLNEYISDYYYYDYSDRKEFTDKDGNIWKSIENKSDGRLNIIYATYINECIISIKFNMAIVDAYNSIIDGMDKSISTISIHKP